jgi:chaperonin GroES
MKLHPTQDRVIVKRQKEPEVSPGGILIPQAAQGKSEKCEVYAVGPGKTLDNGTVLPMGVKIGDVVIISKWEGTEVKLDGQDLLFVKSDAIQGVVEP